MNIRTIFLFCSAAILLTCSCGNSSSSTPAETPVDMSATAVTAPVEEEPTGDSRLAEHIVISKEAMTLKLYDSQQRLICSFPVAVGKNLGNKRRSGDMKTPEGEFKVQQIQPASHWTHDFGDGKGVIEGCYGNWFIRLETPPHRGIGIHGTHDPASIGTRATEGCIRLHNNDLDSLKPMVKVGMRVTIETSVADRNEDNRIDGKPVTEEKPVVDVTPEISEPATAPQSEDTAQSATKREIATPESQPTGGAASGEVWHTIESGDMIGALAIKYGVTEEQIRELNPGLNERRLQLGQRVRIK